MFDFGVVAGCLRLDSRDKSPQIDSNSRKVDNISRAVSGVARSLRWRGRETGQIPVPNPRTTFPLLPILLLILFPKISCLCCAAQRGVQTACFFFFFTLVTGPRRSLSFKQTACGGVRGAPMWFPIPHPPYNHVPFRSRLILEPRTGEWTVGAFLPLYPKCPKCPSPAANPAPLPSPRQKNTIGTLNPKP